MNIPHSTLTSNKNQYTDRTSLHILRTCKAWSTTKCTLGLSCISHLNLLQRDSCIHLLLASHVTSQSLTYFFVKLRLQGNPSTNMHLSSLRTFQSTTNETRCLSQFSRSHSPSLLRFLPFFLKVEYM